MKYKKFDFLNGVNREDRFQLITYAASYLRKYKIIDSGIIYPIGESNCDKINAIKPQYLWVGNIKIPFKVRFYKIKQDIAWQRIVGNNFLDKFFCNLKEITSSTEEKLIN